jgi:hypothetical protein
MSDLRLASFRIKLREGIVLDLTPDSPKGWGQKWDQDLTPSWLLIVVNSYV